MANGISIFAENIDKALNQFPEIRSEILQEAADGLLDTVRSNIGGNGKIAGWQVCRIGNKNTRKPPGGFAIVQPTGDAAVEGGKVYPASGGGNGKDYSRAAITNAIESGHGIRRPKGGGKYRPRIRVTHVPGRGFYRAAEGKVYTVLQNAGNRIMERIGSVIEGE